MKEYNVPCQRKAEHDGLSEAELEKIGLRSQTPPPSICTKIQKIRCSGSAAKALLFRFIPILSWLPRYPVKEWLLGDIISGFSVGIMNLPQGLAYALLAGLPPVTGLYTAFYPVLAYFIFGTSRHISVGPFAVISVMIGSVTVALEPSEKYLEVINGTNDTINEPLRDAARIELVATLTFLVGIFQIALGLLQFGFVATYLSEPLVRGYITAASIQVLVSQLKYVFGMHLEERSGPLSLIYTFVEICSKLPGTNVGTLVTALISIIAIFLVKMLNEKLGKRLPIPIPIELLTIIVSTGISYAVGLNKAFGISIVGDIPNGMRPPDIPKVCYFGKVAGSSFAIAIVSYVLTISLGKIFALKHGYKVDSNQELIAIGCSNSVGGFFQCYSISASMSRSLVQESTGGQSQVASVVSCLLILATILKIGELFQDLPKAILAAIVIVNLKGMFKQFSDIPALWRTNVIDLLIWLVTFTATILLNLDLGLGVAVAFALLTVIFRTQMPHYSILGEVSLTGIYKDVKEYHNAEEIPGVRIFRSSATLYFANAELYAEALKNKCGIDVTRLIEKKKKALKKKERRDKKEAKKIKKMTSEIKKAQDSGNNNIAFVDIDMEVKSQKMTSEIKNAQESGNNNIAFADIDMEVKSQEPEDNANMAELNGSMKVWEHEKDTQQPQSHFNPSLKSLGLEKPSLHSLILDFTPVNFVDTVCIKTLKNIFKDFQEIEVDVFLAGCHGSVISQMERGNFFSQTITKHQLFASVHDAVTYIIRNQGERLPQTDTINPSTML
ncbi:solute carrier family 26 member 6 [Elgaria multicarinata webbii]|uniref:solute carrier family 26 member 6 n=1 Tax=Elgaria multicarinata webbii TaxID=159646 RepID=UPI002FCD4B41